MHRNRYPGFRTDPGNQGKTPQVESEGISWTIWVFDHEWGGAKIKNWNYELTAGGEFFKLAIQGKLQFQVKK